MAILDDLARFLNHFFDQLHLFPPELGKAFKAFFKEPTLVGFSSVFLGLAGRLKGVLAFVGLALLAQTPGAMKKFSPMLLIGAFFAGFVQVGDWFGWDFLSVLPAIVIGTLFAWLFYFLFTSEEPRG